MPSQSFEDALIKYRAALKTARLRDDHPLLKPSMVLFDELDLMYIAFAIEKKRGRSNYIDGFFKYSAYLAGPIVQQTKLERLWGIKPVAGGRYWHFTRGFFWWMFVDPEWKKQVKELREALKAVDPADYKHMYVALGGTPLHNP